MRSISQFIFLSVVVSLMTLPVAEARKYYKRMPLNEALTTELNRVLRAANAMHGAFYDQNEEQIETSVEEVLNAIDKANEKSVLAEGQRPHVVKMLNSTKNEINVLRNSSGDKRKTSLKNAMEQLVLIAQTYDLDKYKIFFCPKDRSVWLQKSWKAKNPIHPKLYASCGKLVR